MQPHVEKTAHLLVSHFYDVPCNAAHFPWEGLTDSERARWLCVAAKLDAYPPKTTIEHQAAWLEHAFLGMDAISIEDAWVDVPTYERKKWMRIAAAIISGKIR